MKNLAAKIMTVLGVVSAGPAYALGIPVIDAANLEQNIVSAVQEVQSVLDQVEQYKTQLEQFETELQNTAAPAMFIWDLASQTMENLQGTIDTFSQYKTTFGDLSSFVNQFRDSTYYSSICATDCTSAGLTARSNASSAQKQANDAAIKGLDLQMTALQKDAASLGALQAQASGATGQMQAIQAANQIASNEAHQLLQIRGLLIAEQNALVTQAQASADRQAQEDAADQKARGTFVPVVSPSAAW